MAKKKSVKAKNKYNSNLSLEIACIVSTCISILLVISIYFNGGGIIGEFFSSSLKGLLGIGAYILPFFIIVSSFILFFSKEKKLNSFKFTIYIIIISLIMSFIHLITKNNLNSTSYSSYILGIYKSGSILNGGVIGALIGDLLSSILGTSFTYVLIIFLITILAVLVLEKSFLKLLESSFKKISNLFYYKYNQEDNNLEEDLKEEPIDPKKKQNFIKTFINKFKAKTVEEPKTLKEEHIPNVLEPLEEPKKIEYAKNKVQINKNYIFYKENKYKKIEKPTIININKNIEQKSNKKISFALDEINQAKNTKSPASFFKMEDKPNKELLFNITQKVNDSYTKNQNNLKINSNINENIQENKNFFLQQEQIEKAKSVFTSNINNSSNKDLEQIVSSEVIFDYDIPTHIEIEQLFNKPPELFLSEDVDFSNFEKLDEFYNFENSINLNNLENSNIDLEPTNSNLNTSSNFSVKPNLENVNISSNKQDFTNPNNLINQKNENIQKNEPYIEKAEKQNFVTELKIDEDSKILSYTFPKLEFLNKNQNLKYENNELELRENSKTLVKTLKSFNVNSEVIKISKGPSVTRYELSIEDGIKVSKILSLDANLALSLAATSIRIEAPIPGKSAVGIEIPNTELESVFLSEVICDEKFQQFNSKVAFGVGKDITGNVIVTDISKMPHMLIAGATGSGKSVCINTLITSILYKSNPEEVRLIMIDPKVVELSVYNGIPHLLLPVVTEPEKAASTLNWAVQEMMERYNLFAETGSRNISGYNEIMLKTGQKKLPKIIIIIDELADLMMVAAKEVESSICRLAQLARAAGIHLIIATQRPSVDVITGLIKANIPSRIAFAVSSGTDSRTVLDSVGAEKLLGKGDMLFKSVDMSKPLRIQGAFISDSEVEKIVNFIKDNSAPNYDPNIINKIEHSERNSESSSSDLNDELTEDVISFLVRKGKASTSLIQRQFRIGYNRAARIIEELEDRGIISSENGSKQRDVLMDKYQFEEYLSRENDY